MINISEGRRLDVIAVIGAVAGDALLDVHTDAHHHRSVLTLAGPDVEDAAFALVAEAVQQIDLRDHDDGAHPRLGAADVIPFVPLAGSTLDDAVAARDRFAKRITDELGVPCVRYGAGERTLPDVRRDPGIGPHATAGICCVGARPLLVAYNLWLARPATIDDAKRVARELRSPTLRTLGLQVGDRVQVSCNLIEPSTTGPDVAFDAVAARVAVARAELVGLVPASVLRSIPEDRWPELDLARWKTIEARLSQAGLDGGSFDVAGAADAADGAQG